MNKPAKTPAERVIKMMKKLIALLLAVLMVSLLFTACKKPTEETTDEENGSVSDETTPTEDGQTADFQGHYDDETLQEGIRKQDVYILDDAAVDDAAFDRIVAVCGDYALTNRMLQFYFWDQYMSFMNTYGDYAAYFGLDATKPLSEQASLAEGLSWEQYFLDSAILVFQEQASVATEAKRSGTELPDGLQEYVDTLEDTLYGYASSDGYETVNDYLSAYYGTGATVSGAKDYILLSGYAGSVQEDVLNAVNYTDEDLEAYYMAHAEDLAEKGVLMDDTALINVRHILITWDDADGDGTPTDEEKAAALAAAEALLAEYETDPTEEHFAQLANDHSTDPGSNTNGGLYENVYPGQMVTSFNDWCFDAARTPGDTGIVETNYGYHIMYFVSKGDMLYWKQYLLENGFAMEMLADKYDFSCEPELIVLGSAGIYLESLTE